MRRDTGSAAVELAGMLPLLLLTAVLVWQGLLVTSTATAAEHAARNGSRALALGDEAGPAALAATPRWLRDSTRVRHDGAGGVTVDISVPLVVPGIVASPWTVSRDAHLPGAG